MRTWDIEHWTQELRTNEPTMICMRFCYISIYFFLSFQRGLHKLASRNQYNTYMPCAVAHCTRNPLEHQTDRDMTDWAPSNRRGDIELSYEFHELKFLIVNYHFLRADHNILFFFVRFGVYFAYFCVLINACARAQLLVFHKNYAASHE